MDRLPRLPMGVGLVTPSGKPTQAFQRWWQSIVEQIETARSTMSDLPPLTLYADYTGTITSGQLPLDVAAKRYFGDTDVTTSSAWSFTVDEGSVTATIGASTGVLNITAVGSATAKITISSVREGATVSRTFSITRSDAAAPPSGGGGGGSGGTTATDSTLGNISSATYAAISDELSVTVGSNGQVDLSAPLTVRTAPTGPATFYVVEGIWRQWDGAAYVDVDVESTSDSVLVEFEAETGRYVVTPGTLTVNPPAVTGLTPGNTEKFQLYAKNDSGTRTMTFTGTASVVAS